MSKKHFDILADSLFSSGLSDDEIRKAANAIADRLSEICPRFDRDKFLNRCIVGK